MGKSLKESLNSFVAANDEEDSIDTSILNKPLTGASKASFFEADIPKYHKKSKSLESSIDELVEETDSLLNAFDNIDSYLDSYVDEYFDIHEDLELKNSLTALGRKYSKEHGTEESMSEIERQFTPQTKLLNGLITEITQDETAVEKDIRNMRDARTRNYNSLSNLIGVKASLYGTKLQAIKELSAVKKSVFDISMKKEKTKIEGASEENASLTLQHILSGGTVGSIVDSIGGRESSIGGSDKNIPNNGASSDFSKGVEDPASYFIDDDISDEEIEKRYFNDDDDSEISEGDLYLKYEKANICLVVQIDPDGTENVVAKDKDGFGSIIDDYPLPKDIDELTFNINTDSMTASDNLYRTYRVEYINKDGSVSTSGEDI